MVALEPLKILIAKDSKNTILLIGKDAKEELQGKYEGLEYHEFDVNAVFGVPELVDFCFEAGI